MVAHAASLVPNMNYGMQNNSLHRQGSKKDHTGFQETKFYTVMLALKNRYPLVLEVNCILIVFTLGVKVRVLINLYGVQASH